jgi:DNA-binding response OmpR family regulator
MLGDENIMKVVLVTEDLLLPDYLENLLDSHRFVLETVNPNPMSIAGVDDAPPDVFVIDSMNSGGDVIKLCQNIRYHGRTPILVLATNHKPDLVEKILDAGADEFLTKPVSGNILSAYLNNLTRRARAEKAAALSTDNGEKRKGQQARLLTY